MANYRCQRLSGASLLVFANKTDVNGCMDEAEIQEVWFRGRWHAAVLTEYRGSSWMRLRHTSGTLFDAVQLQVQIWKKALSGLCKMPKQGSFSIRTLWWCQVCVLPFHWR